MPSVAPPLRISAVAAHLLLVAATGHVTHPHRRPTQISHHPRQAPACPCTTTTLENLQVIEKRLRANTFYTVVTDFSAHALKPQSPRIDRLGESSPRFTYSGDPRLHASPLDVFPPRPDLPQHPRVDIIQLLRWVSLEHGLIFPDDVGCERGSHDASCIPVEGRVTVDIPPLIPKRVRKTARPSGS